MSIAEDEVVAYCSFVVVVHEEEDDDDVYRRRSDTPGDDWKAEATDTRNAQDKMGTRQLDNIIVGIENKSSLIDCEKLVSNSTR